jgi:CrcB protein
MLAVLAIALGASFGALLRWVLGNQLNALFPFLPPGTLAANLLGGYLIGLAVAFFATHPTLPPNGGCSPSPASWAGSPPSPPSRPRSSPS